MLKRINRQLHVYEPRLAGNELAYVKDCLESGWISSLGKYIPEFEQKFADYCGVQYGVATSNGTVAIHLALLGLGIREGDEVLLPSLTFVASANPVLYVGATPVFVDVDETSWTLDPEQLERSITPRSRAIVVVHLYGQPCAMDKILEIARRHRLVVIEDAAESHGAVYHGKRAGSFGNISCFSFYGNKTITTGEGGMCLTNDLHSAELIRHLRDQAMSKEKRYWHDVVGYNYRMTNIQAAIGVAQLEQIDALLDRKRAIADLYTRKLRGVPGITTPPEVPGTRNSYWMYSCLVDERQYGLDRDRLMARLRGYGIDTRNFFYPLHTLPMYRSWGRPLPVTERIAGTGLNLPSSPNLTDEEVTYITDAVCEIHTAG